jgi:hypothetical protein
MSLQAIDLNKICTILRLSVTNFAFYRYYICKINTILWGLNVVMEGFDLTPRKSILSPLLNFAHLGRHDRQN